MGAWQVSSAQMLGSVHSVGDSRALYLAGHYVGTNFHSNIFGQAIPPGDINGPSSVQLGGWNSPFGNGNVSSTGVGANSSDQFTVGASTETYSASLNSFAELSSTASNAGAFTEVSALEHAGAEDTLFFTANQATAFTVSGDSTLTGSRNMLADGDLRHGLVLDDITAGTFVSFLSGSGAPGSFGGSALLVAGDSYMLQSSVQSYASLSLGQTTQDNSGSGQSSLNYVATFGRPNVTPEPFTIGLGMAGVGMFLRRRMKARG